MAITANTLQTYTTGYGGANATFVGNAVDVLDFITNVSPEQRPFWSMIEKGKAFSTLHEWLTDTLATPAANARIEGDQLGDTAITGRTRDNNYTQIIADVVEISTTQQNVRMYAGVQDEMNYQTVKFMKKILRDMEYAFFNNSTGGNSGATGTARQLKPVTDYIASGNKFNPSGGANATPVEQDLNNATQLAWIGGGDPDTVLCSGYHKRDISAITVPSGTQRIVQADSATVVRAIDMYRSDFDMLNIVPSRYITLTGASPNGVANIYILEKARWRCDYLTNPEQQDLAPGPLSMRRVVRSEGTLVGLAPAANAQITSAGSAFD